MIKPFLRFRKVIGRYGLKGTISYSLSILPGIIDYYLNPRSVKRSSLPAVDYDRILFELSSLNIPAIPFTIDTAQFHSWLKEVSFPQSYIDSCGSIFPEKALEYYVGLKLLDLGKEDTFVDVGAGHSPWVKMVRKYIGCTAYALDLAYPAGIHDDKIGADATSIPLPDDSITKICLHCSYETFAGNADNRFIRETERVLSPGGKMMILPLYLHNSYFVDSSPWADRRNVDYDGAPRIWRDDGHIVTFSRKYSVQAFVQRLLENRGCLSFSLYCVQNETEVADICYLKFAIVFHKPHTS